MDCSMPGSPVHYQLLEPTQTHVHWVSDTIQPSHPLLSSSPPTFNLSQHHGLFHWVSSSHQVARVLEFQLQHQSFQWIFRIDFLEDCLVESPWCPRDSRESSPAPQFKSINSSAFSFLYGNSHIHTWLLEKTAFLQRSKHLLIAWLQSPSAVILESKKIKSVTVSIVSSPICHEVMGLDLSFLNAEF